MVEKLLDVVKSKRKILIQTHNNPDPDAIAAAFALKSLIYQTQKKRVTIAYMGLIGRTENKELVKQCKIDMYLLSKLDVSRYDCLIYVDTQPTAGNIAEICDHPPEIVIDHHNLRNACEKTLFHDIRTNYGSTSTIITEYYKELKIIPDVYVATALYYGIKTDTFGTARSNIQADMDMMSYIFPHISLSKITKIENPDLPRYYFKTLKKAIEQTTIIDSLLFCDLGEVRHADSIAETSDFFLRMRDVKCTIVVGRIENTCYFSLRYKTSKKSVGKLASSIVKGLGHGGGHVKSAGGQIQLTNKTYEQVVKLLKTRLIVKLGHKDALEKNI